MKEVLRVGTTEGRFRMVFPTLLEEFNALCPNVRLIGSIATADTLMDMLNNKEIDIAFCGIPAREYKEIKREKLFDEKLFLVASDGLLKEGFKEEELKGGADLKLFEDIPFSLSMPNLHCMKILDTLLKREGIKLDVIHRSPHFDLHQELAAKNYSACFSLSMYLPHLEELNKRIDNKLHYFPIKGLEETNPVYVFSNKEETPKSGSNEFKSILKRLCSRLEEY